MSSTDLEIDSTPLSTVTRWLAPFAVALPSIGVVMFLALVSSLAPAKPLPEQWDLALVFALLGGLLLAPLFAWGVLARIKKQVLNVDMRRFLTALQWGFVLYYPVGYLYLTQPWRTHCNL